MEVSAEVWYWTPHGMTEDARLARGSERYVTVREAERLLQEANAAGYRRGKEAVADEVRRQL